MKTFTLLAAAFLLSTVGHAHGIINVSGESKISFSFDEPIQFTERGIEFFVFPNGEFDFNTATSADSGIYYKNGRRNSNKTYGAALNQGVRIEHDAMGRVRRIGNVFFNYDAQNRIKRIGSVYMTYNRTGLTQIGNLKIIYDRRDRIIKILGTVKGYAYQINDCDACNYLGNENSQTYYRISGTKIEE